MIGFEWPEITLRNFQHLWTRTDVDVNGEIFKQNPVIHQELCCFQADQEVEYLCGQTVFAADIPQSRL